jgi:predicted nuclease with TOPRIM domain
MSDQATNVKGEIEKTKERLEVLEEIDLLESEFRLIRNEYFQRKHHLESRLEKLTPAQT